MQIVQLHSIDDFIAELRSEQSTIADKIVRWTWTRTPQRDGFEHAVDCWATSLRKGGDEDYLIEYGRQVGIDVADSEDDGEKEQGTKAAMEQFDKLTEACDDMGLKLRPGKIEVF